jgi:hypothetical protein
MCAQRIMAGLQRGRVEEGIPNTVAQIERLSGRLTALLKLREIYAMGQLIGKVE